MVEFSNLASNEFLVVRSFNGYGDGSYFFRNFDELTEHFFDVLLDKWYHWKDKRLVWDSENTFYVDKRHFYVFIEHFGVL